MARTQVATQKITRAGLTPTMSQPIVDGDVVDCGGTFVYVDNASAGSIDVTVQSPVTVSGLDVEDLVVAVAAGAVKLIGPFPPSVFARPSGDVDAGRMYVNYSSQASVTRAVVSF